MIKLVLSALSLALIGTVASAQQTNLPESFVGASVSAMADVYGAPVQTTEVEGVQVYVFEVTSYESYSAVVRANQHSRGNQANAYYSDVLSGASSTSRRHAMEHISRINSDHRRHGSMIDRARLHRPTPMLCRIGVTVDEFETVRTVQVSDRACRSVSLR